MGAIWICLFDAFPFTAVSLSSNTMSPAVVGIVDWRYVLWTLQV